MNYLLAVGAWLLWLAALVTVVPRVSRWLDPPWLVGRVQFRRYPRWSALLALPPSLALGLLFGESPRGLRTELEMLGFMTVVVVLLLIVVTGILFLVGLTRFNRPPR